MLRRTGKMNKEARELTVAGFKAWCMQPTEEEFGG